MPVDPHPSAEPYRASAVSVDATDAMELVQMLTVLGEWLDSTDSPALDASLRRFAHDAYDITDLRSDLARCAFLHGADGELLFGDPP